MSVAKDKKSTISVQGTAITVLSHQAEDYISLTDMAKEFGGDALIYSWMRNRNTVEFLGIWEQIHNPDFKGGEFETFRTQAGLNSFHLTPKKWIDAFLNYFLLSTAGQRQIDSFQAGGNRQGLNFEQIRSFRIPLTPLPEQRAIADREDQAGVSVPESTGGQSRKAPAHPADCNSSRVK